MAGLFTGSVHIRGCGGADQIIAGVNAARACFIRHFPGVSETAAIVPLCMENKGDGKRELSWNRRAAPVTKARQPEQTRSCPITKSASAAQPRPHP